jgi:thioredoxin-related protein
MQYFSSTDKRRSGALFLCLLMLLPVVATALDPEDPSIYEFDDAVLDEPLEHPEWFKESFMDLQDDLQEALENDKRLVVYFGQRRCAYCKALMEVNFGLEDIVAYTRRHFDIVAVDIWSVEELTDTRGQALSQREFAVREGTNFTPSLIFYDERGHIVLRLRGYYPPYKFRAALEYVSDHHYRGESFADYLARADPTMSFEPGGLNEQDYFQPPPYAFDRTRFAAQRPLAVFFEQGNCHACDVLHTQPLQEPNIQEMMWDLDVAQLNMWADTPVLTPGGRRTTAQAWARELGLFYAPTVIFFDEGGHEIIRVGSVVRLYRLRNVLDYVLSRGYRVEPNFQHWRSRHGRAMTFAGDSN